MRHSTKDSFNGCALCTVSDVLSPKGHEAHNLTAEEEIARRRGPSTTPGHVALAQIATPDPSVPTSPAEDTHPAPVVPSSPSARPESPSALEQPCDKSPDHPARQPNPIPATSHPELSATQDQPHPSSLQPRFATHIPPTPEGGNGDGQGSPHVTPSLSPRLDSNQPILPAIPVIDETDRPISPAAPVIDGTDRPGDGPGSLVGGCHQEGRAPPPIGIFALSDTSPFITAATINYLQTISAGQRWVDMVSSYLRLEGFPVAKGVSLDLSFFFFSASS